MTIEIDKLLRFIDPILRLNDFGRMLLEFELLAMCLYPLVNLSTGLAYHLAVMNGLIDLDIRVLLLFFTLLVHFREWAHDWRHNLLALFNADSINLNAHFADLIQPLLVAITF